MSARGLSWAMNEPHDLPPLLRLVLIYLGDSMNPDDASAYINIPDVAKVLDVSTGDVLSAVQGLIERGVVSYIPGSVAEVPYDGGTRGYWLLPLLEPASA